MLKLTMIKLTMAKLLKKLNYHMIYISVQKIKILHIVAIHQQFKAFANFIWQINFLNIF